MFFHNFKYSLKNAFRQKEFLFWILAFPIILGTFFYVAFNSMYEKESMFNKYRWQSLKILKILPLKK